MSSLVNMFAEVGVVAGALVALFTAVIMAVRRLHDLGRWLHEINTVVNKELTRNGGSSMLDQVHTISRKLDQAKTELARLQGTVDHHIADQRAHASDPTAHLRPTDPDDGSAGPR